VQTITVNGKPFNEAAKWEALQNTLGKISGMRNAPDTVQELQGTPFLAPPSPPPPLSLLLLG